MTSCINTMTYLQILELFFVCVFCFFFSNITIIKLQRLYKFYCDLQKMGIAKNKKFAKEITQLLDLYQEQWRLLDKTSDILQTLAG